MPDIYNDNIPKFDVEDRNAVDFFMTCKAKYAADRKDWEPKWQQALATFHNNDNTERIYKGRSNIRIPIMRSKVLGVASRIVRVIFNSVPFARFEDKKIGSVQKTFVDLWNKFVFEHQLNVINFKEAFKSFIRTKTKIGTAVAFISQEFEEKVMTQPGVNGEDPKEETVIVKDNTYFRNILITQFYSDVNKENIDDSQACIYSTTMSFSDLKKEERKKVKVEYEVVDSNTNEVIGIEEQMEEVGKYKNLNLLTVDGSNLTEEQEEYAQWLGLNKTQLGEYKKELKNNHKTGNVRIDICYGRYPLEKDNGEVEDTEVICVIANGKVVIQGPEPTPFQHQRYVRPFIVGRYYAIPGCLYGESNVTVGSVLNQEYNASRAQAVDAKTQSIFPMIYQDVSKNIVWDYNWRPGGVIKGDGPHGIEHLINPNLSNISINDSLLIQRDIDQLFSLSPVQEGTSDKRLIPSTARGTNAVIAQNDIVINEIIETTIEEDVKKFLEMLFERNITFKELSDLLVVWDEKEIQRSIGSDIESIYDTTFDFNVKILGNVELSNETSKQQGWITFLDQAAKNPVLAKRVNWVNAADKLLRSYGIKDDSEGLFYDEETMMEINQQSQQSQAAQKEQAIKDQVLAQDLEIRKERKIKEIDTEADIVKKTHEVVLEAQTGQKVM